MADLRGGFLGFLEGQKQSVLRDQQVADEERRRKAQMADFQERVRTQAIINETAREKADVRGRERADIQFGRQKEIIGLRADVSRADKVIARKDNAERTFVATEALKPSKFVPFVQKDFVGRLQSMLDDNPQFNGQIEDFDSFKLASLSLPNAPAFADGGLIAMKSALTLEKRANRFIANIATIDPVVASENGLPSISDIMSDDFTIEKMNQFEELAGNLSSIEKSIELREQSNDLKARLALEALTAIPGFDTDGLTDAQKSNPIFLENLLRDLRADIAEGKKISEEELTQEKKGEIKAVATEFRDRKDRLEKERDNLDRDLNPREGRPTTLTETEREKKNERLDEINAELETISQDQRVAEQKIRNTFNTRRRAGKTSARSRVVGSPQSTTSGRELNKIIGTNDDPLVGSMGASIIRIAGQKSSASKTKDLDSMEADLTKLHKGGQLKDKAFNELMEMIKSAR